MATEQLVEETIEHVADAAELVAEEATQVAEATRRLSPRSVGFLVVGLGLGAVGGFAAGYFVMEKRLKTKYEKLAEEEIAQMREHYQRLRIALQNEAQSRRPLEELLIDRGYTTRLEGPDEIVVVKVEPEAPEEKDAPQPVTENIFEASRPQREWDYAVEVKKRAGKETYVLHRDEYDQNENDWTQSTITYYEGDDVLCDERDEVIENQDAVIGHDNMWLFGHGSGDPNIVYIRNNRLNHEYEVLRHDGKYAIEVQGFEEEQDLRHSSERRRRVNRGFDDDEDN